MEITLRKNISFDFACMKYFEYKSASKLFKAIILLRPTKYERLCSKADIDIANLHSLHL